MLKRILDNQLHLHDEGNPAWGMSGNPYGYKSQEEKDIERFAEFAQSLSSSNSKGPLPESKNFADELKEMSNKFVSPKLEGVKRVLKSAATQGNKEVSLAANQIDDYVIKWLEKEGLKVKSNWSGTREEGQTYYEISW